MLELVSLKMKCNNSFGYSLLGSIALVSLKFSVLCFCRQMVVYFFLRNESADVCLLVVQVITEFAPPQLSRFQQRHLTNNSSTKKKLGLQEQLIIITKYVTRSACKIVLRETHCEGGGKRDLIILSATYLCPLL